MSAGREEQGEPGDWEITSDGFYVARRDFLIRRGYCCGNRCRNCPYINWHSGSEWQPIPAELVKCGRVLPKAIGVAQALLDYHKQELGRCVQGERGWHERMVEHYGGLVERWGGGSY